MYELPTPLHVEQGEFRTDSLQVWIKRPRPGHGNWWILFVSSDRYETWAWNEAIKQCCEEELKAWPFHQSTQVIDPNHHRSCQEMFHDHCPGTVHGWEMLGLGHGEFALDCPDEPLEELARAGDEPLKGLLAALPVIAKRARAILAHEY